jgi:tricorn protease
MRSLILILLLISPVLKAQQKGYYRYPAIHGQWIVFTAEGDLWKYDLASSHTSRLTTHHGMESEPLFSPDGKQIVFTGQLEGSPELYTIASTGGIPKRLTYINSWEVKAISWLPDGKILYTARNESALEDNQLFKLDPNTLAYETIPLAQAADGAYDTKGTLYFTRLAFQGSHTKRYKGGTAQNIWRFSGNAPSTCITCDYTGTSREAMFYKDRIYFASDRDGTMNIWSMNLDSKDLKQHTFSSGWDLMSPSIHDSKIVYQKGADIGLYDIEKNEDRILDISIQSDFDQRSPHWIKTPADKISYWEVSPGGKFIALISRGRLFVSPANGSRWVEITHKSGVRYKMVAFLDEKNVVYLSDESGEYEIWKALADGSGTPQQLTRNAKVLITNLYVAPNGKHIAYTDKDLKLFLYSVADGTTKLIEQNLSGGAAGVTWAKEDYFTYEVPADNDNGMLRSYHIPTAKQETITTTRSNNYNAQYTSDNEWLYFVTERNLVSTVGSPWGLRQPEPYYDKTAKIFAMALKEDLVYPFMQPDGWTEDKKEEEPKSEDKGAKPKKQEEKKVPAVVVDWKAASSRLYEVPIQGKNILRMRLAEKHIYWTEIEAGQWNKQKLFALKIGYDKKIEPTLIADDITGYDLSPDKKKVVIEKNNTLYVANADGVKADLEKTKLDLSNWVFQFDPVDDWRQMFNDAWRMERDYFYDPKLHGVDWVSIKNRYESLLPRITDRYELDNLIAQMVSELSALHIFVYGGEKRQPPVEIPIASLGAKLQRNVSGVGYTIAHIFKGDPDYPESLSPLMKPHLKIKEGDVLLKINDQSVNEPASLSLALSGKANVWVKLTLRNVNNVEYTQLVKPIAEWEESNLRYTEWVYTRRQEVEQKTSAQVGYIHLRAMTQPDMDDFVKQFYPVFNRGGLILDVRHNGGGNIDSWILEKLMRKAWFYWQPRIGNPYWNMQYAFRGHIVVLCDEATGSDGEAVTEGIRRLNLGTIIGTRTWGGEVWLTSRNRLVDGGIATAAEFGVYADGQWLIEGHGVEPDIVVDNEPYTTYQGKDTQLEAAIKFLQEKLVKEPLPVPKAPAYPDKSFKYKE